MKSDLEPRLRPEVEFCSGRQEFAEKSTERILKALEVASEIHKEDVRKVTGEPYLNHCVAVASILENLGADEDEVIAGLLHDTVENHPEKISLQNMVEMFGERVAYLVDAVTKLEPREEDEDEFETLRKVTKESFIEPGVALIKLADRLHNMLTMEGMSEESQKRNAKETLSVYAPLAESFGLWQIKNLLQDLSFKYIDPKRYLWVKNAIDADPRLNNELLEKREREIREKLTKNGIEAKIEHQVGGYWEMSEKQKKFGMRASASPNSFADITDVISFRIIAEDGKMADCYKAMGAVRLLYKDRLMKQRHNDYLAVPAVNGYSALHDTYRFEDGDVEIAFSTKSREEFNNWGVISLSNDELRTNAEMYKRKLIFTPKKELVFMEPTATGIDVAYKLNPLLGLRAVGMKVDERICGLDEVVPNSSVVVVIYDQEQIRPNREWLRYGNASTKRLVEQQLLVSERDEEVSKGRVILTSEVLEERGILNLSDLDSKLVGKLLMDLGCWNGPDDLYYKVAYGFDLNTVRRKMDELGVVKGRYTSIQIKGTNKIGVSTELAQLVSRFGGDARNKVEKVDDQERFTVRILLTIGYEAKKKMEHAMKEKYPDCLVV